jgi:hypothetical protein
MDQQQPKKVKNNETRKRQRRQTLPCLATINSMDTKHTSTASAKKQKSLERDWALAPANKGPRTRTQVAKGTAIRANIKRSKIKKKKAILFASRNYSKPQFFGDFFRVLFSREGISRQKKEKKN